MNISPETIAFVQELVQNQSGWVMPAIVDLVNQHVTNSRVRFILSIIITFLLATLLNLDQLVSINSWADAGVFAGTVSFLFAQSQIAYKLYWEKSQLRSNLYSIPESQSK